jgi:hypothetical protein
MNWTKVTKNAWQDEIASGSYDVFGTLKFIDGSCISDTKATRLWGAYWHKVDRVIFGHAANRGLGVNRWCFDELGECTENRHLHFVAQSPMCTVTFCTALNAIWSDFCADAAPMRHNFITPIRCKRDTGGYIVKEISDDRFSFSGLKCSHRSTANNETSELEMTGRLNRTLARVPNSRMNEALAVLEWQIAEEQRRLIQRSVY